MADWYFRSQPNQPNRLKACPECRNLVSVNAKICPYCGRQARGVMPGGLQKFFQRPFIVTELLIGIIGVAFFLQIVSDFLAGADRDVTSWLLKGSTSLTYIRMGSNLHILTAMAGEYWRLVTYCFLHGGIIHIGFNCFAFRDLGRIAERLWGSRQVFAVFILTGIGGGIGSLTWNMAMGHPTNSVGASGAICGILGLLLGAYYRNRHQVGEFLGSQLLRWAIYILVFGLVVGADNAAHIGGMLSGGVIGYFLPPTAHTKTYSRDKKIWTAAALLSLVLLLASVGMAIQFYAQGPGYAISLVNKVAAAFQ